jgi:hypothetical protein
MFKRAICQDDLPPYRVRYVLFLYDEHGFEMELNDDPHDLTDGCEWSIILVFMTASKSKCYIIIDT